jgi:carboxyl-terminal processing protease
LRVPVVLTLLTVALLAAVGPAATRSDDQTLADFTRALAIVRDEYVEEVDTGELIRGAIQEMLGSLDPHSDYLDLEMHERLKQEHSGSFFGVGMTISLRGGHLTVISPIDGTPAARAGIRAGDRITAIDGEPADGMTTSEAALRIRGPKGTEVTLSVLRGDGPPVDYELVRDRIPLYSVPYAFLIRPGTAYIRIASFGRTTADEVDSALVRLSDEGMEELLLDLRWNSGGLYDAAVEVADRFLPEGDVIVTTKGRTRGADRRSVAGAQPTWRTLPLVVLVNHGSASASEIVAGAVQDHHRGVVAGTATFGKGLVQSLYKLSDGGALKLTTARYYTPSGRCIQRSYKGQREEEYERRGLSLEGRDGGIDPDVHLEATRPLLGIVDAARRRGLLFEFAKGYLERHPVGPDATPWNGTDLTSCKLPEGFAPELDEFLSSQEIPYGGSEFEAASPELEVYVRAEIAGLTWNQEARYRVLADLDDQLGSALGLLDEARALVAQATP